MNRSPLDTEFSLTITKKAGDPQMDFCYDGDINDVGSGIIHTLACMTVMAHDVGSATEQIIDAYRDSVRDHMERIGMNA